MMKGHVSPQSRNKVGASGFEAERNLVVDVVSAGATAGDEGTEALYFAKSRSQVLRKRENLRAPGRGGEAP